MSHAGAPLCGVCLYIAFLSTLKRGANHPCAVLPFRPSQGCEAGTQLSTFIPPGQERQRAIAASKRSKISTDAAATLTSNPSTPNPSTPTPVPTSANGQPPEPLHGDILRPPSPPSAAPPGAKPVGANVSAAASGGPPHRIVISPAPRPAEADGAGTTTGPPGGGAGDGSAAGGVGRPPFRVKLKMGGPK